MYIKGSYSGYSLAVMISHFRLGATPPVKYHEQVQDQTVYTRITGRRRNPTTKVKMELQNGPKNLKLSRNLTETEYWRLKPFDCCSAMFFWFTKSAYSTSCMQYDDHFTLDKRLSGDIPLRPING